MVSLPYGLDRQNGDFSGDADGVGFPAQNASPRQLQRSGFGSHVVHIAELGFDPRSPEFHRDLFMTGKQAVEYGLVDEVIVSRSIKKV